MSPLEEKMLSENTRQVFACQNDGKRVGFAIGTIDGETLRLEAINVSPLFRRLGHGTEMLQNMEDWGRKNGATNLRGEFLPDRGMRKAVSSFYGKNQVEITGRFLFKKLR